MYLGNVYSDTLLYVKLRKGFIICQVALGYNKHYNTSNPFDWMELISLQYALNLTYFLHAFQTVCIALRILTPSNLS